MITVDGLTVEFGGTTLFKDISFQINEKDRIALMGKNGAGKSTLLKIIAGVRNATRGSVSAPKDCVIAYLPQHLMTEDGRTVFEETCQAFAHLHEMQAEIDRINNELTTRTDYDSDDYMQLIEKVSSLSEKFYAIDMTHFEEDVEKTLLGLGFERSDFNRPTSEFSGGWRMRIELAKLLLEKGADINYHKPDMVFPYASTPVTEAARSNNFSMVRWLVEQGADITIVDKYGDRPYSVAVQNKNQEMADYLKALEPEEWHNEQEKIRQLMPYKLPAKLVEYLKTGPLRLEFPDQEWVKWAELYSFMDVQEMTWKRKKLLSLMVQMDNYSDYLLLWSPRDKKLWYLDIEHEEFHPLAKWDDFIADPGRYLNGMIEGEFEE